MRDLDDRSAGDEPGTSAFGRRSDAPIELRRGLPERHRQAAAALYYEAFAELLRPVLGGPAQALELLAQALDRSRAIVATQGDTLLGVCGLHRDGGNFVALEVRPLLRVFGVIDGLRRVLVGGLIDRRPGPGELVIDGIAVDPQARGRGVAAALLAEVERFAEERGLSTIRLDVRDDNHSARKLYHRVGFMAGATTSSWLVRRIYGIRALTTMTRCVPPRPPLHP